MGSLYLSVRQARERSHSIEYHKYDASWLPAIFQNPAVDPPTWQDLRGMNIWENWEIG